MPRKSANQVVLDIGAELSLLNERDFYRKVQALAKTKGLGISLDEKSIIEGWSKIRGDLQKKMMEMIVAATSAGFSAGAIKGSQKALANLAKQIEGLQAEQYTLAAALATATDKATRKQLEADHDRGQKRLHDLEKQYKVEEDRQKKLMDRRSKAMAKIDKQEQSNRGEAFASHAQNIWGVASMRNMGAAPDLLRKLGIGAQKQGVKATTAAGTAEGGKLASVLGGLGKTLGIVGKSLAVIGGVAAGIAALVTIFVELDAKTKDWNKALIDAGVSGGDLASTGLLAADAFGRARKAFNSVEFARTWNKTAEESMKVVGALQEAGVSLKTMVNDTQTEDQSIQSLQQHVATMYGSAGALGIEVTQLAETVGQYMDELAMTFEGVKDGLDGIYKAAMASGFGTKRFFSQVLQATTGMSMYNVRLKDTAGLLMKLTKILGIRAGGEFLQSLTKGFMGESRLDSAKRIKTTGVAQSRNIISADTRATVDAFRQGLAGRMAEGGVKGGALNDFYKMAQTKGLDFSKQSTGELAESLAKLSRTDQAELVGQMAKADEEGARELMKLVDLARGQKGDLVQMGSSLDALSAGGTLAMQLNTGFGVWGKPLSQLSDMQLAAVENSLGLTREQTKQLRLIDATLQAQYKDSKEKGEGMSYEEFVTRHGADAMENAPKVLSPMEEATRDIVSNTMKLTDLIEHVTNGILNSIADYVSGIAAWVIGGESPAVKAAKNAAVQQANEMAVAYQRQAGAMTTEIVAKSKEVAGMKKGSPAREAAEQELADMQARQKALTEQSTRARKTAREVADMDLSAQSNKAQAKRMVQEHVQGVLSPERQAAAQRRAAERLDAYASTLPQPYTGFGATEDADIKDSQRLAKIDAMKSQLIDEELAKEMAGATADADLAETQARVRKEDTVKPTGARKDAYEDQADSAKALSTMPEDTAKAIQESTLVGALGSVGFEGDAAQAAKDILAGKMPEEVKAFLATKGKFMGGAGEESAGQAVLRLGGTGLGPAAKLINGAIAPAAKDFIYADGRVTPFNRADVLVGSKEGEALDRVAGAAGRGRRGGANVAIYNYFYQDAKGNHQNMQAMLEAAGVV